ncbi:MAG: HIT family protein [Betaproteobacteria bacterium]|nr:HIT family protein [Betaproteobacteria bacterium]
MSAQCELCLVIDNQEEDILWNDGFCYVRSVADPYYPGFCRVIVRRHVREMTDLSQKEREHLMSVVFAVEKSLREVLRPDKINLASLGNAVPHLHWHVIPRWRGDRHFPLSIWGSPQRESAPALPAPDFQNLAAAIAAALPRDTHEY